MLYILQAVKNSKCVSVVQCDICVRDIHFGDKISIKLVGKGGKARIVTIPAQCAALLKDYLSSVNKLTYLGSHVFSSQTNEHMTTSCVEIVKKYLRIARMENSTLFREKKYTPHSFRHSVAVLLGHLSIEVTTIYATVSDALKNKYLQENSFTSALPGNSKKMIEIYKLSEL